MSDVGVGGAIRVFLIADVRGYTLFTQEHGDEAAARLAKRFADIVREGAGAHGGALIELRGDEALAAFESPRGAIQAALELQSRFVDEALERSELPLLVGIGMDAGEAVAVEDGFRGGALNLAARLCSMAGPGEILASREVVHLARALEGVVYVERGEARVKGLTGPVPVIRVMPETDDPAERLTRAKAAPAPSMRVMLADDSILLREGVARLLTDAGFAVVAQAGDAKGLLDAVDADPPNVAIVDIRMPPSRCRRPGAVAVRGGGLRHGPGLGGRGGARISPQGSRRKRPGVHGCSQASGGRGFGHRS
jgi:class 3 adenylate cyclase